MKKSISFTLFLIGFLCFSCNKEDGSLEEIVNVQLTPSLITLSEGSDKPMTTKATSSNDSVLYAIQVYENDIEYYYGLFNDISKIQIALTTSKTYKFKVTAYKTGTGKGLKTLNDADGVNYYLPYKIPLKNMFIKGDLLKDIDLTSSVILNGQPKEYPEVDVFYTTKKLTLEKGTTSIDFTLLRMGFGLNLNVDALTSGDMEVYLGNDTLKLNSSQTTATTVRLFNILNGNFNNIHSKADTYGDSILLKVKWAGKNGTIIETQRNYLFNRNYQKTINIQLNTLTGGLSFENWKSLLDGLIAWYPFNGNANDESGNGNNGIVNGAKLTNDRFGNSNSAYSFDGATNYIEVPYNKSFNNPDFSISCWVSSTNSSIQTIIKQNTYADASNERFAISLNQKELYDVLFSVKYNSSIPSVGWNENRSNYNVLDGKFHNIIGTVNGNITKLYVDGVLLSTLETQFSQSFIPIGGELQIGREWSMFNYYFKGKIDDIGLWNRVLTQNEITDLSNYRL